ncbi:M23 family metallopeptidase [Candidatus Synechococcus calcipolaris G9]|uniref:M23 family metallopeptidase n=1 Tax=Candidatus Synechococcus calcipolaris G9 TaxID=1497997 RepID=A0ABT6F0S7_9SYNE|nr:M23 family metallopeptidase [Candidatus Synechococcus calcipolaris]MDG2991426.1 M23 family metallopeptidase [Candidatus Synechococcus calcipolaris G9]
MGSGVVEQRLMVKMMAKAAVYQLGLGLGLAATVFSAGLGLAEGLDTPESSEVSRSNPVQAIDSQPLVIPVQPVDPVGETWNTYSPPATTTGQFPVNPQPLDIDPESYGIGATQAPQPTQVVIQERSSGCQATVQLGQGVPQAICDPGVRAHAPETAALNPNRIGANLQASLQGSRLEPGYDNPSGNGRSLTAVRRSFPGPNPIKWLALNGKNMLFPLASPAPITSPFGWRIHPIFGTMRFHAGTDMGAPEGTPVLAVHDGRVVESGDIGGYGLTVILQHPPNQKQTLYAHLSELFVNPGEWVEQGEVIGLVGSTGNSTGPHLHFEILEMTANGLIPVDPGGRLELALQQLIQAMQVAQNQGNRATQ